MDQSTVMKIELPLELQDNTATGARSATANLQGVMAAAQQTQTVLNGVTSKQHQVTVSLIDRVTAPIRNITSSLTALTGKTWQLTLQVRDFVTAPLRGVFNLLQSIAGTISNPWNLLGAVGVGYVGQQAVSSFLGAPLQLYDQYTQARIGLTAANQGMYKMPAAQANSSADALLQQAITFGQNQTPFTANQVRDWMTSLYVKGFSPGQIFGSGSNNTGSYLKSIIDMSTARYGIGGEGRDRIASLIQAISMAKGEGYVTGDLIQSFIPYENVWQILGSAIQKQAGLTQMPNPLQIQGWASERRLPLDWTLQTLLNGGEATYPDIAKTLTRSTVAGQMSILNDVFQQKVMLPFGGGEAGPLIKFLQGFTDSLTSGQNASRLEGLSGQLGKLGTSITSFGTGLATDAITALQRLLDDPNFDRAPDLMGKLAVAWGHMDLGGKIHMAWDWLTSSLTDWVAQHQDDIAKAAGGFGSALGGAIHGGVMAMLGVGESTGSSDAGGGSSDTWGTAGANAGKSFWKAFGDSLNGDELRTALQNALIGGPKNLVTGEGGGFGNMFNLLVPIIIAWLGRGLIGQGIGSLFSAGAGGLSSIGGGLSGLAAGGAAGNATALSQVAGAGSLLGLASIFALIGYDVFGNNFGRGSNNSATPVLSGLGDVIPFLLGGKVGGDMPQWVKDLTAALDRLRNSVDVNTAHAATLPGTPSSGGTGTAVGTGPGGSVTVKDLTEAQNDSFSCGAVVTAGILTASGYATTYADQKAAAMQGYGMTSTMGQSAADMNRQLHDQAGLTAHPLNTKEDVMNAVRQGYLVHVDTPAHHALAQSVDENGNLYFGNSGAYMAGSGYNGWRSLDSAVDAWGGFQGAYYYTRPDGSPVTGIALDTLRGGVGSSTGVGGAIDSSSHASFVQSIYPYALEWSQKTGLPVDYYIAWAASESNWGKAGNALFGIKGSGDAGSLNSPTWEMVNGQRVNTTDGFAQYSSPEAAFSGLDQFLSGPRYAAAYAALKAGGITPRQFMERINGAGYATNPAWGDTIADSAASTIDTLLHGGGKGGPGGSSLITIQSVTVQIGAGADEEQGKAAGAAFLSTITSAVHSARVNRKPGA